MRPDIKPILLRGLMVAFALIIVTAALAQPPIGGPPPCWPPPCIPIDGGVGMLLAAGALFGGRQAWRLRNKGGNKR